MPEQMTLPDDARELAELLAERVGLVGGGRLELIYDRENRYTDGYKHERLRVSKMSATPAFPPCRCTANTSLNVNGLCIVCGGSKQRASVASIE